MSIGGRIFLGIVLIQVVSAALILGWFFYSVQSELSERTRHNAQAAVLRSIEASEAYLRPAEAVAQAGQRLIVGNVLGRDRPDQLERYFFEQLRLWPQIAGLYVGYPDGGFFYVMRSDQEIAEGTRTKVIRQRPEGREVALTWRDPDYATVKTEHDPEDPYDPRARAWYRAAIEQRGSVWTEPYIFFTSRKPGITAAVAVRNDDDTIAAVVGVDIEMSEVSTFLTQLSLGMGGSAYIVTPEGEVIAHSGVDPVLPDSVAGDDSLRFRKVTDLRGIEGTVGERVLARVSSPAGATTPIIWEEESDGTDYFVAIGRMSNMSWPWQITVIVPAKRLVEVARASNLILVGVILLATALACAVGYALSQSIGRPLAVLHRNAKLARHGNIEVMDEVASGYKEIRETADTLRDLAELRRRYGAPPKTETADERPDSGGKRGR